MKIVWKEVLEGWRNHLFPPKALKELIKETQQERLAICRSCPFNSTPKRINMFSECLSCGCPLNQKSACLHCRCPEGKWGPITEKEETEAIREYINQKENESD